MHAGNRSTDRNPTDSATRRQTIAAIPVLIFLAQRAACAWSGLTLDIPWAYYQILDRHELESHPVWSLLFLHSQPPLLNGLLATILAGSTALGLPPETLCNLFFAGIAAFVIWGVFQLTLDVTRHAGWATVAALVMAADPGLHLFEHQFFYPLLLQALLLMLALCAVRYLREGQPRHLLGAVLAIVLACNTGSLYHPVWALGAGALVLWPVHGRRVSRSLVLLAAGLLVIGMVCWPLKNLFVFGQYTTSSWEGYNLARGVPGLEEELARSGWRNDAELGYKELKASFPGAPTATLESRFKTDGSVNMNQYRLLALNTRLKAFAVNWRVKHLREWSSMAVAQYWMWTRAAYADCYVPGLSVGGNEWYRGYAMLHQAVFFPDLRPILERCWPALKRLACSHVTHQPVAITLFGLLVFPAILTTSILRATSAQSEADHAIRRTSMVMVLCILWVLFVPCLTDGHEGNRMRFAVDPLITVLGLKLLHDLFQEKGQLVRGAPM